MSMSTFYWLFYKNNFIMTTSPNRNSRQRFLFVLFFLSFLSTGLFAQNDLSLSAEISNTPASTNWTAGESVVFRLIVTNDGVQNNTAVNVSVPTPANMTLLSAGAASAGTSFSGTA